MRTDLKLLCLKIFGGLGCSKTGGGVTRTRVMNTQRAHVATVSTVRGMEIAAKSQALWVNFI